MDDKTTIICKTIYGIVSVLTVGEIFGNIISGPIAAWRRAGVSRQELEERFTVINQRICNLEERSKEEAE